MKCGGGVPAHFIMPVEKYNEKMKAYYQDNPWRTTNISELKTKQNAFFDESFEAQK